MKDNRSPWAYTEASLAKSYFLSLANSSLPVVSGFVTSWVVARWAGPQVVGTVSWVMAFATACLIVGKFGFGLAVSRLASELGVKEEGRLRALLRRGLEMRLAATLPVAGACLLAAPSLASFFGDPDLVAPIRVGSLVIVGASLYEYKEHFLVGLNRLATVYRVRLLHHSLRIVLTVAVVALGWGAVQVLGAYCVAWVVAIAAYLFLLLRHLPPARKGAGAGLRSRLLRLSLPLAASGASVTLYSQMDKIMVGYFMGVEEVGQYTIARNVAEVSLFPIFASIMALRPALASRFARGEREKCAYVVGQTLLWGLAFGTLFALVFGFFGQQLVVLVFSPRFQRAGSLMGLFVWLVMMRSLGAVILPSLVAAERTRAYAYLTALSAGLNFFLNLLLIPLMGARGAVMATIGSYALLLVLGLHQTKAAFAMKISGQALKKVSKVAAAGMTSALIVALLIPKSAGGMAVVAEAAVAGIIFAAILWLSGSAKDLMVRPSAGESS